MKLLPIVAVIASFALSSVAFAQPTPTPTNKADCEKAGGMWQTASSSCMKK